MARVFRLLLRVLLGIFAIAFFVILLAYFFVSRSLPDYAETETVPGLNAPVEIIRNNYAVPHIVSENDADAFFALGYAHAQDRLWQMTMLRRTAQGRLSEIFGSRTLKTDIILRRFDLYNLSLASVEDQSQDAKEMLEAYANGVNAWIAQINEGARGRGAPEMWMFNHAISPWEPADSLAIIKLMAAQLSGQLETDVLRAELSLQLPEERLRDIMPDDPGAGTIALPEYAALVPGALPTGRYASAEFPFSPFPAPAFAGASNAFAANSDRLTSQSTLLANDPHLQLQAPSIWYLARIQLSTGSVIGGTIPGLPLVLVGRSENLGWGLTTAYVDDQDVYIEQLNPENAQEYRTPEGYKPFRSRESLINVKDETATTIKLLWTENGPVMPPDYAGLGEITPAGHVAAISWTALSPDDTSFSAGLKMMRAQSTDEAISAMEGYIAPAQNLTLSDRNGIAFKTVGAIPRRDPTSQTQGRLPAFGYIPQNRWQGRMPYEDNPEVRDPDGGIVGNTNNKTVDRPFPNHVSYNWGDDTRVHRWRRLMQLREVHTRESFIETQLDTVSYAARSILPLIGADLWYTSQAAAADTLEGKRHRALTLLADWNGEMNEHMPEPLIYAAWVRALQNRLIRDELGPLAADFKHIEPVFIERVYRNVDGASVWCDVIQSAPTETCSDIARMALDDAIIWLEQTYGTELETLRWGAAHEAYQDHVVLGDVPVLKWFVNIRQSTSGGDFTLNRGRTSGEDPNPFINVHAGSYRGVYDFSDPDSSVFILSTGQSGHFLSSHYDDLSELWRRGEYIPMSLDLDLARAASVGITQLVPEGQAAEPEAPEAPETDS